MFQSLLIAVIGSLNNLGKGGSPHSDIIPAKLSGREMKTNRPYTYFYKLYMPLYTSATGHQWWGRDPLQGSLAVPRPSLAYPPESRDLLMDEEGGNLE